MWLVLFSSRKLNVLASMRSTMKRLSLIWVMPTTLATKISSPVSRPCDVIVTTAGLACVTPVIDSVALLRPARLSSEVSALLAVTLYLKVTEPAEPTDRLRAVGAAWAGSVSSSVSVQLVCPRRDSS